MDKSSNKTDAGTQGILTAPFLNRRLGACVFYVACLVLWLLAVAGGLELWARLQPLPSFETPPSIPVDVHAARRLFEPIYVRYCAGWPVPLEEPPNLAELPDEDETERERIAAAREEWVLLVDADLHVLGAYGRPAFSSAMLKEEFFVELLKDAVRRVFSGEYLPPTTLPMRASDTADTVRVAFQPVVKNENITALFLAFSRSLYRPDSKRFKPNFVLKTFNTTVMMEQFSTNNLGYRGPDVAVPKPPGTLRIACIGGSTTVWGFRDDLTYPAMLQKMLRDRFPGQAHRIEVVNCGIFGLNSTEEPELAAEIMLLEPDLLLYYNFINDLTLHFGRWLRSDEAWDGCTGRLKRMLRCSHFLDRYANVWLLPGESCLNEFLSKTILCNIEAMVNITREHGVPVGLCSFAGITPDTVSPGNKAYVEQALVRTILPDLDLAAYTWVRELYNDLINTVCTGEDVFYIPVAEEVLGECDLFMDECHFSAAGQGRVFLRVQVPPR
jgi:hypothetical protein